MLISKMIWQVRVVICMENGVNKSHIFTYYLDGIISETYHM